MTDTTTKEQVILGTIKGMQEIGEYSRELEEYVKRRLDRAYELGYNEGWRNNERIKEGEAKLRNEADEDNEPSKTVNS